ncbi:MAG: YheU family protein [Gammaproteobacteria bacterium]|nr:YheU family protein [Gammaproteobacteria bacterium]MDE0367655.1 YheU family protein [Gammaproteobacteria bacterium]
MEIPLDALSDEALLGVIESFVLREGTDYGHRDFSLEQKCRAVRRQLERGEARLVFDEETQSPGIVPAGDLAGSTTSRQ